MKAVHLTASDMERLCLRFIFSHILYDLCHICETYLSFTSLMRGYRIADVFAVKYYFFYIIYTFKPSFK